MDGKHTAGSEQAAKSDGAQNAVAGKQSSYDDKKSLESRLFSGNNENANTNKGLPPALVDVDNVAASSSKTKSSIHKPENVPKRNAEPTAPPPRGSGPWGPNAGPAKDSLPINPKTTSRFRNIVIAVAATSKTDPLKVAKDEWDASGLEIQSIITKTKTNQDLTDEELIVWFAYLASQYNMEFCQKFDEHVNSIFRASRKMLVMGTNEIVGFALMDESDKNTIAVQAIKGRAFLPLLVAMMIGLVNKNKRYKEFSNIDIDDAVQQFQPLYQEIQGVQKGWEKDWANIVVCDKRIREETFKACIGYIADQHSHVTTGFPVDMPKIKAALSSVFNLYHRATVQFIKQKRELQDVERFHKLEADRQKIRAMEMSDDSEESNE